MKSLQLFSASIYLTLYSSHTICWSRNIFLYHLELSILQPLPLDQNRRHTIDPFYAGEGSNDALVAAIQGNVHSVWGSEPEWIKNQ